MIMITHPVKRSKMNILDELDDFMNQTYIVKRNKKNHSMSK